MSDTETTGVEHGHKSWFGLRPPRSVEICLASDFIDRGNTLHNPADEELIQLCGSCGHRVRAFHSEYDGDADTFREYYCPVCFNSCFRDSTVIVTRGYDSRQESKDYVRKYILRRFNQRAWKGDVADVDTDAPQIMIDGMPQPTEVAKTQLAMADIEWDVVCPACGVQESEARFDFHHWDYDRDHGCRMCRDCHNAIHGGERAREQAATTGREWEYDAVKRLHDRVTSNGLTWAEYDAEDFVRRFNIQNNMNAAKAVDEVFSDE